MMRHLAKLSAKNPIYSIDSYDDSKAEIAERVLYSKPYIAIMTGLLGYHRHIRPSTPSNFKVGANLDLATKCNLPDWLVKGCKPIHVQEMQLFSPELKAYVAWLIWQAPVKDAKSKAIAADAACVYEDALAYYTKLDPDGQRLAARLLTLETAYPVIAEIPFRVMAAGTLKRSRGAAAADLDAAGANLGKDDE